MIEPVVTTKERDPANLGGGAQPFYKLEAISTDACQARIECVVEAFADQVEGQLEIRQLDVLIEKRVGVVRIGQQALGEVALLPDSYVRVADNGRGIKADDNLIASLCFQCHSMIDQGSSLSKAERMAIWFDAHYLTVHILRMRGLWPEDVPLPKGFS